MSRRAARAATSERPSLILTTHSPAYRGFFTPAERSIYASATQEL